MKNLNTDKTIEKKKKMCVFDNTSEMFFLITLLGLVTIKLKISKKKKRNKQITIEFGNVKCEIVWIMHGRHLLPCQDFYIYLPALRGVDKQGYLGLYKALGTCLNR